jgi:uncharacterized oxidoreductase
MKIKDNSILITGGATGIGFALAKVFVEEGNDVTICGRREEKLKEAQNKLPELNIIKCDVTKIEDRIFLYSLKDINILINNAGILRMIDLKTDKSSLYAENEIETNLLAPIQLTTGFMAQLLEKKESAIINVTSGLAFVPMAAMPIYCATKAGMHSFSLSLRHQLRNTSIKIFEVMPPIVDTDIHKEARNELKNRSIPPSEVAKATLESLQKDEYEIVVGMAQGLRTGSRYSPEQTFSGINGM